MIIEFYEHKNPLEIIPKDIFNNTLCELKKIDFKSEPYIVNALRKKVLSKLRMNGWSQEIRVSKHSRITITSKNMSVGLCLQLGNISRFYADLLKLETMFVNKSISSAIYITLLHKDSLLMGSNLTNYTRLSNELENIFSKIITIPLIILGIGNDD